MEELKSKIKELVESLNYYLYDVEYVKEDENYVLRVMIDNDVYINIDDTVIVSKELSELLDEIDPFEEPYMLEVTSGGAERELRNDDEIKRAVGKPVYVETFDQRYEGILEKFKDNILTIKDKRKKVSKVNLIDVNLIRLTIML